MEAFAPGVEVLEKEAFPSIEAVGASLSGILVESGRGPDNVLTLLSNLDQYVTRYGGPDGNHGYPSVKGYFDQEGAGLYVGRAIGAGAAGAELISASIDPGELLVGAPTGLTLPSGTPVSLLLATHGLTTGDSIILKGVGGLSPSITGSYIVTVTDPSNFTLDGTDGDDYTGSPVLTSATVIKAEPTMKLLASSVGVWGNDTFITINKYETLVDVAVSSGVVVKFASLVGVQVGDVIQIQEGALELTSIIVEIDTGTRNVTIRDTVASSFTIAATIKCTSVHKTNTTLATAYTAGTVIEVSSAATIEKGSLLLLISDNGDRVVEARVDTLNGNILTCTILYADGSVEIPADSIVVSTNFDIVHTVDGSGVRYENLSLESLNRSDYFIDKLAQTEYLRGEAVAATPATYRSYIYPGILNSAALAGGLDGAAPVTNDWLGTNTGKTYKHGIKLFDNVEVLPQFAIPGSIVAVQKGMLSYAKSNGTTVALIETDEDTDTLEEIAAYRNITLNEFTKYGALYTPWLIEDDPVTSGLKITVPPTGKVMGRWSEVSLRRGTQKPPANELLTNVDDVTARFSKPERAQLNALGVNPITNKSGRGVRIMGARTLWPNADRHQFLNVRRMLNSIKIGLKDFGDTQVFEPSDDDLWKNIKKEGDKYLETLWKLGWLFPRNDKTKAFFFRCDATTNTEALRKAGKVRSIVGVNPVLPAELIEFELVLWDGGSSIVEL